MAGSEMRREADYGVLVALLVTCTLALGSVVYQLTGQAHQHGGASGQAWLGVSVDGFGTALMLVLGMQMMLGYHLFRLGRPSFRRAHVTVAWVIVGLMAAHGASALAHSLSGVVETLPLVLDALGILVAAALAVQLRSGYRLSADGASGARRLHATVAVAAAVVLVAHGAGGVLHTLTG